MKIRASFICLLILFAFPGHTGLAQNTRDLTHYDDGGAFDFSWSFGPEGRVQMKRKLRDFLWEHWTQKRPARVVVTVYTIEGDPTTYNLFVEFDSGQRWRVVAKYESFCCWFYDMEKPKRKRKRTKGVLLYDVMERVPISGKDLAPLPSTGGENRVADSYLLRLRRSVDGDRLARELIF